MDFEIVRGTTKRLLVTGVDADGGPYNYTNTTVRFLIATTPATEKTIVVNGSGTGTSTTGIRLGQPDPTNHEGPLINTAATSGYLTIRFSPAETAAMDPGDYAYEARVESTGIDGADAYSLQTGKITIVPSLFEA